MTNSALQHEGVLLVNKPVGKTSFRLVAELRRRLGVKKIGHAGTLDPFATGVMVMLIGRNYTRLSDHLIKDDKEYVGRIHLGVTTDTYDCEGETIAVNETVPSLQDVEEVLKTFQGEIEQIPPMFSAKKINGKKLYDLARKGQVIERQPVKVLVELELLHYSYPYIDIRVACSKGTYIRSLAYDIGAKLGCGAHLSQLTRIRCGKYHLKECLDGNEIPNLDFNLAELIRKAV